MFLKFLFSFLWKPALISRRICRHSQSIGNNRKQGREILANHCLVNVAEMNVVSSRIISEFTASPYAVDVSWRSKQKMATALRELVDYIYIPWKGIEQQL